MLRRGHIFLNTSLTEAYCMAIVEAASCGLQVVSTKVGGIPEVLPNKLITLTEASVDALYNGLLSAIERIIHSRKIKPNGVANGITNMKKTRVLVDDVLCPYECNETVRTLYNWNNITVRTEKVYRHVMKEHDPSFGDKLNCYLKACVPFVLVVSFSYLLLCFLDWIEPRKNIDKTIRTKSSSNAINHHRKNRMKK